MTSRLYRTRRDRIIGGVCGGLGAYFGIDPVIVRLVFVALAIWGGAGVPIYLILWIIIPPEERAGAISQEVIGSNVSEIESEAQRFAHEARDVFGGRGTAPKERTMWAAAALIIFGGLLLFGNLTGFAFQRLWPVLLIVLGGVLIYQAITRR